MSAQGKQVTLDYIGWQSPEQDETAWILAVLRRAVRQSGAREVHAHAEAFDGTISPPGFAAIVLIDESHVSAHCYSQRGLLAVDAFTCGDTDADQIADLIHADIIAAIPSIKLVKRNSVERFVNGE
jgi:S-adenosylmethionine decarboxylase